MLKTYAVAYYSNFDAEMQLFFVKARTELAAHIHAYIDLKGIDLAKELNEYDKAAFACTSVSEFVDFVVTEEEQLIVKEVP